MNTRLALSRRRLVKLAGRRAQERSTSIAAIALYSATMNQLGAERQGDFGLLRAASAALHANLCRPSNSYRLLLEAGGGLKLHSLSGRGFVQPGLSTVRHHPAAGSA